jgi:hypothetical protein
MRIQITRGLMLLGLAVAVALTAWGFTGRKKIERRDDLVQSALKLVRENAALSTGVRVETYRAAGEYVLAQPDGEGTAAKDHLANARNIFSAPDAKPTGQPFERPALLARIALTQAALVGDSAQIRNKTRLDWAATLKEIRYTLVAFEPDPAQWEGSILAVRGLTRSFGLRGATPEQPAILGLVLNRFDSPTERADALAAIGLELFGAGETGQKKAKELAERVHAVSEAAGAPRVVALLAATGVSDPPKSDNPPVGARVGAAEGFARRGDLDAARKIAEAPGSPEDRLQALVAIAATQPPESADVIAAVDFFAKEFKTRDLPDWPLIQLSQICAESKAPDPAKKLNAALAELGNLSPRSQAVRSWAQMELLRSPHLPATVAAVKAIVPETSLGHLIAWEVLARRTASPDGSPDSARPLALVGAALGSMK